jgi:putative spermidine/putrescine transport system permease protein
MGMSPQDAPLTPTLSPHAERGRLGASSSPAPRGRLGLGRWAFLGTVALTYLFILSPVIFVSWISFFRDEIVAFPPSGYSLRWFANAWNSRVFFRGFALSLEVALFAMVVGVTLGTLASLALVRARFPGREAAKLVLLSPLIVPGIVAGTAIYVFYVRIDDLLDWRLVATLPGLVIAHVMLTVPWSVRLVTASLTGLDRAAEDAAMNLGAGPWTTFRRITLPMMRAGIVAAALFSFIISFENLEMSLFLTGPGRVTLPVAILQYLEFKIDPTIAAVSFVQIIVIGAAMLISDRFVKLSRVI